MKHFTSAIYEFSQSARVFIPGKPFLPILFFVCKARILPLSGASERFFNRVDSCFISKHKTRLERLASD